MMKKSSFYILTLGCPKNEADSDRIVSTLLQCGFSRTANPEKATYILINTCSFIQAAVEESIETILDIASLKEVDKTKNVVVLGCLYQRYGDSLKRLLPEVDLFVHMNDYRNLPWLLDRPVNTTDGVGETSLPRDYFSGTERGWTYIKIAEGCEGSCSFCTIPRIKGPLVSRPVEEILEEASLAISLGIKEIILVAQDTSSYGKDLYGEPSLSVLLKDLVHLRGDFWIRLMYVQPEGVDGALLELLQENKVCSYLDIPLQHVDEKVLRKMGRKGGEKKFSSLMKMLRERVPGIALRSSFIVGFPGEDDTSFNRLKRFVENANFDWLSLFRFSPEEGTRAHSMGGWAGRAAAERRLSILREIQEEIMLQKARDMVGARIKVLVEGESEVAPGFLSRSP